MEETRPLSSVYNENNVWWLSLLHQLGANRRQFPPRRQIVAERSWPAETVVIARGWAFSATRDVRGKRRIVKFHIPGDLVLNMGLSGSRHNRSLEAISATTIYRFESQAFLDMCFEDKELYLNLLNSINVDRRQLDILITQLKTNRAELRLASFFLELFRRLKSARLVEENGADCPIKLNQIANNIGLSDAYVGKVLAGLHRSELLEFRDGRLNVLQELELEKLCMSDL
ncbi:MAG: Crp/Fnr family transcriptional regulator [Proteobacteria bacterium]|nr:Crp/Fnr family transcriptional regulator [Pseudomonadota bacterium]